MQATQELTASDPDCPDCGTRCHPSANGAWWMCRTCRVAVLVGREAESRLGVLQ
jgi:ribosomal protein L37AE/L43A